MQIDRFSAALVVGIACTFMFVESALAWGSCGRGPWVRYNEISHCSCGDGQRGYAREDRNGMFVRAEGGPSNGWVAAEFEKYDDDGNRVFVPASARTFNEEYDGDTAIWAPNTSYFQAWQVSWFWAGGWIYSGRYRSVCLTNYTNFEVPEGPWAY